MKYESWGELEQPFFTHHSKLSELEKQLYGHVLDAIDWDALARLEQGLVHLISVKLRTSIELAIDLASAIMDRALDRVAGDSSRYGDPGPPLGITEAEAKAVAFDETCPFCVDERKDDGRGDNDNDNDDVHDGHQANGAVDEPCPCCEELARSWRQEHREVLVKAGLWKPEKPS